ncbi:hypothetical protein ACFQ3P_41170 [Paraburkholderia sabiae]|uniref:Uncharacterized protein n=1 Tax=Paraburkholderia sabiae TaxID=273251 RepID=A0ABU9QRL4_9BURK|nr:hypothetical protein [Paraburkholderia sabiae]WJZ79368.1 hypothetical protein QEN71_41810 [Paraburkholderia sabiae]CAD6563040.1 hypothetical protein LMG24235_08282 [Paraburkholderia sabiae]
MSIHVSFGVFRWALGILKKTSSWLLDKLTRWFILPTYRRSHLTWMKRTQLGASWCELWDGVEYDISFPHFGYPEPRACRVAFRSLTKEVSRLELILEVRGAGLRHQESIRVCNLNAHAIIVTLPGIPELELKLSEKNLRFSIEEYEFLAGKVVFPDGAERAHASSLRGSLVQNFAFNDVWDYRWGHWWNCNSIKYATQQIQEYWRFRYGFRTLLSSILGGTLGASWMSSFQFWAAVASQLFVLSNDGELRWRWGRGDEIVVNC